jgi:transposase
LELAINALLSARDVLLDQLRRLDRKILVAAKADPVVRMLMTAPGVGAFVALTFRSAIDDPSRFKRSKDVGAWLGLTPRRYQSGNTDRIGHITKAGDAGARTALYEAATTLLERMTRWSSVKSWGIRIAGRHGVKKARVAVARKLAIILHTMWKTNMPFRWTATAEAAA